MDILFEMKAGDEIIDEQFDYNKWTERRKQTTRLFYLESAALGMEYALTFVTLYVYLKDVLLVDNVVLFYSIISAIFIISQITVSLIFGRLFDRHRNLQTMFLIGNSLIIIGNVLYTIPWSPWLLFIGRMVSGGGGSLRAIMTSELTRSYSENELMPKFSAMGMSFAIGFIVGPAINFFFVNADFWILGVNINYANGSGLVLTFVFMIVEVLAIFYVSDLSEEYDMKQQTKIRELKRMSPSKDDQDILTEFSKNSQLGRMSSLSIFCKLICNANTCLLLLFSLFFMHCMVCFDIWQPMACINLMKWSILEINIINFGYGITAAVVLLIIAYKPPSNGAIVYLAVACVVGVASVLAIYLTMTLYSSNNSLNIFLWCAYCFWFAIIVIMEEVFLIGTLAQMVPSSIQAFAESIRLACSRLGAVIGLLAAASEFQFLTYVSISYILIACIVLALLIWRKNHYQRPKIQEF